MKKIVVFITLILALIMCMASCDLLKSLDPQPEHTHEFGEWSTTENATCTKEGVKVRYCTCGEKQSEVVPKSSHNVVIDEALNPSCTTTGLTEGKHCSVCNEVLVAQTVIDELVHNYSNGACTRCGATLYVRCDEDGTLNENGDYILFGEYPQTKVTDTTLSEALSAMASSDGWISYKYYIEGSNTTDFMWYQDVTYGTERYRGVYFTSYRPYHTDSSGSNTYQDNNGYTLNTAATAYWFKWEPLMWTILTESNGEALLLCNSIIDSMEYYNNSTSNRTENGETVYPNNYAESNIRAWLNSTFYETAFNELQQAIILQTEVDNSAKSTNPYGDETYWNSGVNDYACENTYDKIFLLSEEEVTNPNYGFSSSYSESDEARRKQTSDYAQCQGCHTYIGSYDGNGWWWLRSPSFDYSTSVRTITGFGNANSYYGVRGTSFGVVPALRIRL